MKKPAENRSIRVFTFSMIMFFCMTLNSLAVTYYTGASGSPSTLTLWWTATNGTGTHPPNFTTSGDIFIIQSGHVMTTTANWTVTGTVTINNGGTLAVISAGTMNFGALTINSGGTAIIDRPLTVNGLTTVSGTISFAATTTKARLMTFTGDVTLNNGAIWNVPATGNGSNDTYNFGGNFTNNATSFNDLGTGTHTFSGSTKTISGSTLISIGSVAITGTVTNTANLTVRTTLSGAGNLTNGTSATLNIGGTATITTLTATSSGNTVNYNGAAQTAKVTTYYNLIISGTGSKTFATSPTVNGLLSLEGTGTVTVTTGVVTYGTTATLQYNKSTPYTATSEEWITPFLASGGIIIKNTGAITTPGPVQIGSNTSVPLNINSGATLTSGSNLITLHGDFINTGTLTTGSGGVTIAGTVSTQSIAGFTTTGTVTLSKTAGTATLQGSVNGGPLTINGSGGTLNLGSGLTHIFSGIVTLTSGVLHGGSSLLVVNSVSTTAWNGTGTVFSAGTGTVNFGASGAQTLSATSTTFNNLIISNSGLKTFSNTPTVNGILSMEGTATVSASPLYGSGATLQYNTSTPRTAGPEWITPFVATGGIRVGNTGIITLNGAKVFNASAPLTINNGSTLSLSTFLLTLNGDLINDGGTVSGSSGGVLITGTANQNIGAFTVTGTVSMTKTGGIAVLQGNINGGALTVNGSGGTMNLGTGLTHTFSGDVTLSAGTLNGGSSLLNELSTTATAWNGTGSVFTANNGTVSFGASGNQTIATNSVFFNLAFTGSGTKTLANSTTIINNLSISGSAVANPGTLSHSSNSLTLGGTIEPGGSWGSTASGATNKNNTYFLSTATGVLNVYCQAPDAPASGGNKTICNGQSVPSLSVTVGSGLTADWYSLANGGTLLQSGSLTYTPSGAGTYYAQSRVISGGCISASRTGVTLTVNQLPAILSLTGGTICSNPGGNGTIVSSTSQSGVNYQLFNKDNSAVQSPKSGTGAALIWSSVGAGTGYYVIGTNTITSCTSTSSPVNISTYTNPDPLVLTGSTDCTFPGGSGVIVSSTSVTGISYQLYDGNGTPVQMPVSGTGDPVAWSDLNAGTGYYVVGTNTTTLCISGNSNSVNISAVESPDPLILTGSTICASPGNNGIITSTASQSGISYQLFDNTDAEVQSPVTGTGSALTWTGLPVGSQYYIIASNLITFCESDRSNEVDVSTSPTPTITSASTAAAICYSTASQNTAISYTATTNSPTQYSISWNAAAHSAGLIDLAFTSLTASPLNIPIAAGVNGGTYTGTLTVSNGCNSFGNSFSVTINTAPGPPAGSPNQMFCSGATVANLSATGTSVTWFSSPSGGSPLSGSTLLTDDTHYYASQTVSGCISSTRLDVTVIVIASGSWIGTTSTDWFTASNWCGGVVPSASTNVVIHPGVDHFPSINASGAVCNNLTIETGASLTITGTNTLSVSGSWTNSGTFVSNSSTVNFTGSASCSIGGGNFNNITFSGSGVKTAAGNLNIAGNVSIANNFTAGSFTHTVGGNWSNNGTFPASGSTIVFSGSGAATISASNFNNITFTGSGTKTATGALTITGNITITSNFTAGPYTHTIDGSWTKTGAFTATGSTIDFSGSASASIGPSNFNNLIFSGAGPKTATGILNIVGSVTITNNFSAGNYTHSLQGNWINNGTFNANGSTFNLIDGISEQGISGSSSSVFNNLTENGNDGALLGIPMYVTGVLTLTNGTIDIGNYNLTVTSSGSVVGGSSGSYVKTSGTGRLKQTVAGAGSVIKNFPVGNSAYNPITVKYNDIIQSDNFSVRVEDGSISNANSPKTVGRKWYLIKDGAGSGNLTLAMTYNSGEEGSGFSNSNTPQIGYFDGTSWAYRPVDSGSGTTTFTASGSAPDFTNTSGFFVLGSGDAFNASKLSVISINPAYPVLGLAVATVTIQSQNSNSIPTMVMTATAFNLSGTNTTLSPSSPSATIAQYTFQTIVTSIAFTTSTYNSGTESYNHNATITATRSSGENLSSGTSGVFDVLLGSIWEPVASENWDAANGWRLSTDGGLTWTNPASLPSGNNFGSSDLIRIPAGITLTANVTASFYSMIVIGTVDISATGNLTLYHNGNDNDYNIHVHGTLKNSGGTLTNSNSTDPIVFHGGTYWHNRNGGSIPVATWTSLDGTPSTCNVTGITSSALTSGLTQTFENFIWNNPSQSVVQNLSADMTINGALTLTAGVITTGSYHVIVGLNGTASNSGSGYINGILRRYVAGSVTTGDFPVGDANYYAPFSIAVNTGTPSGNGFLDVSTTAAQPPASSGLSQTKYINRKWTITNNGVGGITSYNPGFTFNSGDKVGNPATSALKLRKFTAGIWYTTNGTASGNTIAATGLSTAGLTASSDFYAGEDDCSSTYAEWLGSTSTDWNTASNWCSGSVPGATTDVTITSSPSRQPVIGSSGGTCRNITIQSGASLSVSGAYDLDVKGNWLNSGSFIPGTGTVSFTGSAAQTISGDATFNNLTVNNASGVRAINNFSVNGLVTLTSTNPDASHGTLDMGSNTLNMPSPSAGFAGIGDLTGIVRRIHIFTPNNLYQFGSSYTSIIFLGTGTQPGEISCKITIGTAMAGKPNSVQRYYSFAQPGTSFTDQITLNLRYLSSELNGNNDSKVVVWDHHSSGTVEEHGKTNSNISEHWVGLTGLTVNYVVRTSLDNKLFGLADYTAAKNTWLGAVNNDWNNIGNWSAGHAPLATEDVMIPDVSSGSNIYPVLSSDVEIKTLEIQTGATLTAGSNNMTINGAANAWQNTGTFYPGSGTVNLTHGVLNDIVTFSGTTQFNNLSFSANTHIRPELGSYTKISGLVLGDPSSIVELTSLENTVEYNGADQIIVNPQTTGFALEGYYNLIISGTGSSILYNGTLAISGNFTSNGTLNLSPGTVTFGGTNPQQVTITGPEPVFENIIVTNPAGVTITNDITVTGILDLSVPNPGPSKGVLETDQNILTMGSSSVTKGIGDVSGIVRRTSFEAGIPFSFGNQFTTITFEPGGTYPTQIQIKIAIGSSPSWKVSAINRIYDLIQTGGNGCSATVATHYLDSELNGNNEDGLVQWTGGGSPVTEWGKSGSNNTDNWVSISNVDLSLFPASFGDLENTLAKSEAITNTWTGSVSVEWSNPLNWTAGIPTSSSNIIIPDAASTVYSPVYSGSISINTLNINNNGILTSAVGATLTINGGTSAWINGGGTFAPSSGTVIFAGLDATIDGNNQFNNLNILSGAGLTPGSGSYISIAGTLTIGGTLNAAIIPNTIDFNGPGDQTIPASDYYNLTISGSRSSNTVTLASPGTIGIAGTFNPSATFTSGSYATGSGTVSFNGNSGVQDIILPFAFANMRVNNISGISLSASISVTGLLTFTAGKISTGPYRVVIGTNSPACTPGSVSGAGAGQYINGNLRRYIPNSTAPTVIFDIGDSINYTPVLVNFTGTTTGCGYIDASSVVSQPPVSSGLSQTKYIGRDWILTNTGVGGFTSFNSTFTFVSDDEVGSPNASELVIRKFNGSAWSATTTGTRGSLSTQASGLIDFGEFMIGEEGCADNQLWFGGTSTDWNTGSNWCTGSVPTSSDNVVIQPGTPYQPHIGSSGSGACKDITILDGAVLTIDGAYSLNVAGNWTNNGTFTQSTGIVNFNGSLAQTIDGPTTFSTLKINNTAGVTLGAAAGVTTLTIGDVTSGSVFSDGGFQIATSGILNLVSGTFRIGSGSSGTSFPGFTTRTIADGSTVDYGSSSEQIIAAVNYCNLTNSGNGQRTLPSSGTIGISGSFTTGSGSFIVTGSTIDFDGATSQTINGMTYNNLTISGTGNNDKKAGGDIVVNGILNLNCSNYSSTQGALHMGQSSDPHEYVLYMGADATTTGTGDVTGFVTRNSFVLGTDYTFGNQFTKINFSADPMPNSVTVELYLTSSDIPWKPDAIHRYYDVTSTGGSSSSRLRFNIHYLNSELNGTSEGNLGFFDYHVTGGDVINHGFTDRDTINNWVGFGNAGLSFLGNAVQDDHFWTLGNTQSGNQCTWLGGSPSGTTDWDLPDNWDGGVPGNSSSVVIPGGRNYYPVLPDGSLSGSRTIGRIEIQSGATLNGTNGTPTLNIAGDTGAWTNYGTINPGSSTIVFNNSAATMEGESDFSNVTISDGAGLTPLTGNIMRIAGVLSLSSTGVLDAVINSNTIEFNGSDQTVIIPNGTTAGYYHLGLSGSGTKTMPASALDIYGNFSLSGTTSATLNGDMSVIGDMQIGSGSGLIVSPAVKLTVTGILTNNAGNSGFIMQSDASGTASLIHNTDNVAATVSRYISGNPEDWHFLSSPVSNQSISGSWLPSGSYGNGTGYDLYLWNETNSCWIYKLDSTSVINWNSVHPGANFETGRGYLYSVQAVNPTKEFKGDLNNGNVTYRLTAAGTDLTLNGFNFIGNPYPSSMDWQSVSGWQRSNLVNSGGGYDMWIWNPAANNYGLCNSSTGITTNGVARYISPMQGFFVLAATSGTMQSDNDVRVHDGAGSWFKKDSGTRPDMISITVTSEAGHGYDETGLLFGSGRNLKGSRKLFSQNLTAPSLFIPADGEDYSVRYLTDTINSPFVTIRFKPGTDGRFSIKMSFNQYDFETLLLEDTKTRSFQNMKTNNLYRFESSKSDDPNRFILHFSESGSIEKPDFPVNIYQSGYDLIVDLSLVRKASDLFVYDFSGQVILTRKLQGNSINTINLDRPTGVLIVLLRNTDGSFCRKLIWIRN